MYSGVSKLERSISELVRSRLEVELSWRVVEKNTGTMSIYVGRPSFVLSLSFFRDHINLSFLYGTQLDG